MSRENHGRAAWRYLLALAALNVCSGCEGGRAAVGSAEAKQPSDSKPTETKSPETRQKAKLTPELVEASEKLLAEHASAPVGSEFPLTVGGKTYTGRIEEHDNPEGEPGRPPGKHRGVTVYER
jgi:hypothetical protein